MICRSLRSLFVVALAGFLLAAGCADEASPQDGAEGEGEGDCEAGDARDCNCADGDSGTQDCVEGAWTECSCAGAACEPGELCASLTAVDPDRVNFAIYGLNSTRTVKIRYANVRDEPIPNARITWAIEDTGTPMPGAQLDTGTSTTDAQGIAENVVHTGTLAGTLKVTVTAPTAAPLVFTIDVSSKDEGSVNVTVEYPQGGFTGQTAFDEVKVYAYAHPAAAVACADLDPYALPQAAFSLDVPMPLPRSVQRSFLNKDDRYTLLALGMKAFPDSAPVPVALACDEAAAVIVGEQTTEITLTLSDLIFPYTGVYEAHIFMDFISMLPDDYEEYVRMVAEFFTDPGDFVLGLLEEVIEEQFSFDVPDAFVPALRSIVNAAINELLPDWVGDTFTVGGDLAGLLQEMEVLNEYVIGAEPTPSDSDAGLLVFPECAEGADACSQGEKWKGFYFNWRLGRCDGLDPEADPYCGRNYLGVDALVAPDDGQAVPPVEGFFNASVRNLWDLSIHKHALRINWGAIVIGVVEKILLPAMVGVRSLDEFVFWVLGGTHPQTNERCDEMGGGSMEENCCDSLAWKIFDDPGSTSWRDVTKSICQAGVPILVDTLTGYLLAQSADSSAFLHIGTADVFDDIPEEEQVPCHLTFEVLDGRMRLSKWGGKPDDQLCTLRAGLEIGELRPDYAEAYFYAERVRDAN